MNDQTPRIPAAVAKAAFSELMRRVQFGSERIIVQNHNRDAMAVVPLGDFQKLNAIELSEHQPAEDERSK